MVSIRGPVRCEVKHANHCASPLMMLHRQSDMPPTTDDIQTMISCSQHQPHCEEGSSTAGKRSGVPHRYHLLCFLADRAKAANRL